MPVSPPPPPDAYEDGALVVATPDVLDLRHGLDVVAAGTGAQVNVNETELAVPEANVTGLVGDLAAKQALAANLTALAGLVSAADTLPYFTGAGTAALTTLSAFIRTLLDDADAATARATLGALSSAAGAVKNANLVASAGVLADMPPGRELTYNEFTAPVTVSATAEASATTVVTATAFTFDGATPVIVEFFAPAANVSASSGDRIAFWLYDGTSIGELGALFNPTATITGGIVAPIHLARRLTPSNAAHTFSVRATRVTANATINAGAGGVGVFMPGYVRISKA